MVLVIGSPCRPEEDALHRVYVVDVSVCGSSACWAGGTCCTSSCATTPNSKLIQWEAGHRLGGDPAQLSVRLLNGEVTPAGTVRRRSQARRIQELVEAIPGVIAVYNEFRFVVDDVAPG
jgi:hypothetical protein